MAREKAPELNSSHRHNESTTKHEAIPFEWSPETSWVNLILIDQAQH